MTGKILFQAGELILRNSLHCGQSFRWVNKENTELFYSTVKIGDTHELVFLNQTEDDCVEYDCYNKQNLPKLETFFRDYFRLDLSLDNLMRDWIEVDPERFKYKQHRGVRVLKQDPWETLCSFICSSNNNISRITKMCHSLATQYGDEVGEFEGVKQYSFPSSDQLVSKATEDELRDLGFGYRAKYIMGTAQLMSMEKDGMTDSEYMLSWRTKGKMSYEDAKEKLMMYPGVGPKVADCVLLMGGLGFDEVVPVDVHIARIAERDYKFNSTSNEIEKLQAKYKNFPITRKKVNYKLDVYRKRFQELWGQYAGWAQCILFSQEIGKTVGANSNDKIVQKRKIDEYEEINKIGEKMDIVSVKVEEEEVSIEEYSVTGRPLRKAVKRAKKVY